MDNYNYIIYDSTTFMWSDELTVEGLKLKIGFNLKLVGTIYDNIMSVYKSGLETFIGKYDFVEYVVKINKSINFLEFSTTDVEKEVGNGF